MRRLTVVGVAAVLAERDISGTATAALQCVVCSIVTESRLLAHSKTTPCPCVLSSTCERMTRGVHVCFNIVHMFDPVDSALQRTYLKLAAVNVHASDAEPERSLEPCPGYVMRAH